MIAVGIIISLAIMVIFSYRYDKKRMQKYFESIKIGDKYCTSFNNVKDGKDYIFPFTIIGKKKSKDLILLIQYEDKSVSKINMATFCHECFDLPVENKDKK